jgi:DNA polymerase-3 subunit beta
LYRHVKIEAVGDSVHLSATDLEVGLCLHVPEVEVQEEGVVLLPHARISPVVGATPDEAVSLSADDGAVLVETEGSRFRILGEDPAEFPVVPELPAEGIVEMDCDVLKYMVRRTVFATADEMGRYALHGVLWVLGSEGTIEMIAADGSRLAHVKKKATNAAGGGSEFIVPKPAMDQLTRLADFGTGIVRFAVAEGRLVAENSAGRLACQLVEGQFPNFRDVIPTESKIKVQLDTKALVSAVRRAGYMTTEETRVVDFRFAPGELLITAEAPDVGHAEVRVPLEYDGEEACIAFNPEFLEEMLSVVEREAVKLRFSDSRSPCVIKAGLDYTYVVSPVVREEAEL